MTADHLDALQDRLGYRFQNPRLLVSAMTHTSSAGTRVDSNERMEFLGDAIMGLVVCQHLYEKLPDAQEGEMTKIKSAVVSRKTCALVADKLRLGEGLILGQGVEAGEHLPRSLAAAAFEAVIAAIYLDGGLEPARRFILDHMADDLREAIDSQHQFNYKSHLQQWAQRTLGVTPQYELLDEKGPDHAKCFEIAVTIRDRQFPGAWGPSKKEAEQRAARLALVAVGELPQDPRSDS
jgi:ribonuclease-3